MLPRIVLLLIQIAAAWYLAGPIKSALPTLVARPYDIFVDATIYAAIVMIVGFAGAFVLKNVRVPGVTALITSLVVAFLLSAITLFNSLTGPINQALPFLGRNPQLYPMIGALVGFFIGKVRRRR